MNADWLVLTSAWLTGLMGGLHCAAMCGGIATAFPSGGETPAWRAALEPNVGRVLGYGIAGAVAGGVGHGIVSLAQWPALSLALRAAVGAALIVAGLRLLGYRGGFAPTALPGRAWRKALRPLQRRLLPANTSTRRLVAGVLWGWLPCGLSATVLVAAWLQVDAARGALTMLAFGLGTLPVMVPLTWSGARLGQRLQRGRWRTAAASLVLTAGLVTLLAPWLMRIPRMHHLLAALGCGSLAA